MKIEDSESLVDWSKFDPTASENGSEAVELLLLAIVIAINTDYLYTTNVDFMDFFLEPLAKWGNIDRIRDSLFIERGYEDLLVTRIEKARQDYYGTDL